MLRREWEALSSAFSFFTRLPFKPGRFCLEQGVLYLPLVGLFLGAYSYFFVKFLKNLLNLKFLALFLLASLYYLADYFHFDGLLDTIDALAAGGGRERRLKVLKTPDVGALGLLFAFFFLLGEYLLVCETLKKEMIWPLILRPLVGREALAFLSLLSRPAKKEGLGFLFLSTSRRRLCLTQLFWLPLLWWEPLSTLVVLTFVLLWRIRLEMAFGGLTGDLLGATVMFSQWLFLAFSLVGGGKPPW